MTVHDARLAAALADRYRIERQLVLAAERFVQEIKTTAALNHPHILSLFDFGSAEGGSRVAVPLVN